MILQIELGDINEFAAEQAVAELRRLKISFEAAGKLRVDRGEMTAEEAYAKMIPINIALNICSEVSLAFAEPVKKETVKPAMDDKGCDPGLICCLCDAPGILISGGYQCSNPQCVRHSVPLPLRTFTGNFS